MRIFVAGSVTVVALITAVAADSTGSWLVRRARTSDADTAGHYPTWKVALTGEGDALDVRIEEDAEAENARGHVFILHKVTVPEDESLTLDFSYATHCENDNRGGMVDMVAFTEGQFGQLEDSSDTEYMFMRRDSAAVLASVKSFIGEDVSDSVPVDDRKRAGFAGQLRRFAGEAMYVGVGWGALHNCDEWGWIENLRITVEEWTPPVKSFFESINLDYPGLEEAKAAWEAGDEQQACAAVSEYYRNRQEPRVPFAPDRDAEHTVSSSDLKAADMALENRFTGQPKYGFIHVAEPIDWSFNPVGDREWPWQFNRHPAWRSLARAWLATGEAKYAKKWVELLRDWVADNPPGTPWSWRTLEAGIRIPLWLGVFFSFIDAPQFTPNDQILMLNSLADHAEYLMPAGSFHSGSNWGLTESRGLLMAGLFLPEFENADNWKETAWGRIQGEIDAQVYSDGAQVELTPSYHGGCARSFLSIARIVRDAGLDVPDAYMERVEKMHEYLMYLAKPDRTFPMLGDAWPGGVNGFLQTGRDFFGREDMRWLLSGGGEGHPPEDVSHSFPHANYHVMRSAWLDPDARWLLFDTAPWGGGHQQPDNLQIILYAYGTTLLPDSGSYLYYGKGRAEHRRTSVHSTLTVDEANQDTSAGQLECWHSDGVIDYADGRHEGYPELTSRRRILFVKPGYWAILDTVTGPGQHIVDQHFQCARGELEISEGGATLYSDAGPGLRIVPLDTHRAEVEVQQGWVSYEYTKRQRRPVLRVRRNGMLPARYVTILAPFAEDKPEFTARELTLAEPQASAAVIEVKFGDHTDYVLMADERVSFDCPEIELEAVCRAGLVRVDSNGEPIMCALVEGSGLSLGGEDVEPGF